MTTRSNQAPAKTQFKRNKAIGNLVLVRSIQSRNQQREAPNKNPTKLATTRPNPVPTNEDSIKIHSLITQNPSNPIEKWEILLENKNASSQWRWNTWWVVGGWVVDPLLLLLPPPSTGLTQWRGESGGWRTPSSSPLPASRPMERGVWWVVGWVGGDVGRISALN